jgi:hypothetical protein
MDALTDVRWVRIDRLSVADLPRYGAVAGCYVMREVASGEVIYIGSTSSLRRRLFANHIGGVGGPTAKRVHASLFDGDYIAGVEVTWLVASDYLSLEMELKRQFGLLGGERLPRWTRR